jgi:hypothetical protein
MKICKQPLSSTVIKFGTHALEGVFVSADWAFYGTGFTSFCLKFLIILLSSDVSYRRTSTYQDNKKYKVIIVLNQSTN